MKGETNTQIADDPKTSQETTLQKVSISFVFPIELLEQFEDFIYQARKHLPTNKKRKLNKTVLLTFALQDIFDEYEKSGSKSYLWKLVSKWGND